MLSSIDSGLRKERRRKKKITNIISFDDDLDGGAEDEEEGEDEAGRMSTRKSPTAPQGSVEEAVDPLEPAFSLFSAHNGLSEPGIVSWAGSPPPSRTPLPDTKSVDNEEEEEEEEVEVYKGRADTQPIPEQ